MLSIINVRKSHEEDDTEEENTDESFQSAEN